MSICPSHSRLFLSCFRCSQPLLISLTHSRSCSHFINDLIFSDRLLRNDETYFLLLLYKQSIHHHQASRHHYWYIKSDLISLVEITTDSSLLIFLKQQKQNPNTKSTPRIHTHTHTLYAIKINSLKIQTHSHT